MDLGTPKPHFNSITPLKTLAPNSHILRYPSLELQHMNLGEMQPHRGVYRKLDRTTRAEQSLRAFRTTSADRCQWSDPRITAASQRLRCPGLQDACVVLSHRPEGWPWPPGLHILHFLQWPRALGGSHLASPPSEMYTEAPLSLPLGFFCSALYTASPVSMWTTATAHHCFER